LAILENASLASAGVIAAGFVAVGVELALAVGFGWGALHAVRLAASIPAKTTAEATFANFMFSPNF
jgi:uncharacterized membrane protein YbjE (DUF340 family)